MLFLYLFKMMIFQFATLVPPKIWRDLMPVETQTHTTPGMGFDPVTPCEKCRNLHPRNMKPGKTRTNNI